MIEHVIDGCTCLGKTCTKCQQLRCIGQYTKDKRLKSKLKSKCRLCSNKENKSWRQKNAEYNDARKRAWEKANPEKAEQIYKRRIAKRRTTNRRSPMKDRPIEEIKQMEWEVNHKQYYKNKQANIARATQYFQDHPGYRAVIEANRRVRKRNGGGSFTYQEWEALKAKYNYTCLCCGKQEPEIQLQADHIVPVFLDGSSCINNIQPLCKSCNSSKGRKILDFRTQNP